MTQCEAWCWTWSAKDHTRYLTPLQQATGNRNQTITRGSLPVRRCQRVGTLDTATGAVLCPTHIGREPLCLSREDAEEVRAQRRKRFRKPRPAAPAPHDGERCEAWCWTKPDLARCRRPGLYDGLHVAVLCDQHADCNPCLTREEADERRCVAKGYKRAVAA